MAKKKKAPKTPKVKKAQKTPKAPRTVKEKITAAAKVISGAAGKAVKSFALTLGSMKVDKEMAADQLEELGELLEDVAKALVTANEKKEAAKTAQATYDSKVNLLLEKLRGFTHPKALPLFDKAQAEADLVSMTAAASSSGAAESAAADPKETVF